MSENNLNQIFYENLMLKFCYIKEEVRDAILPNLNPLLFNNDDNKEIVNHILLFVEKYNKFPKPKESILKLKESTKMHFINNIMSIDSDEYDDDVLLDELEKFIKEKMIINICYETIMSMDKKDNDNNINNSNTPDKLREAYSFKFNDKIGLNLLKSAERIYNYIHEMKSIIPTNITLLNKYIDGGFHSKSLSLFMAETNMGKSLVISSLAMSHVMQNKKVLFITGELSEDESALRMIANLWKFNIRDLKTKSKSEFIDGFSKLDNQWGDNLIIYEFSAKSFNSNDIRNLLKRLKNKKFIPDIIFIDQIGNLNAIHKLRVDNTYTEMGKVTQEVRSIAMESNVPIVSVIQANREGFGSSELDLKHTSDSIGYVQTADLVVSITQTEELRKVGKYIWKILKNRYGANQIKFTVNVNYQHMAIYDDEDAIVEQEIITSASDVKKNKIKKGLAIVDRINTNNINNDTNTNIFKWE